MTRPVYGSSEMKNIFHTSSLKGFHQNETFFFTTPIVVVNDLLLYLPSTLIRKSQKHV